MSSDPAPSIEMRHLRLVAAISELGSVTAAARTLNLTQPALSHQLRELETKLRTPLFIRTAKAMVPTPAGEKLITIARSLVGQVREFERQVLSGDYTETVGSVRMATECYTCYHWMPGVLKVFRERWPGVDLRITPEYTATPVAALRDGALDLAIVHSPRGDKRIRFEPLFDDELVAVCSPRHRFARQPFVTESDFEREHLIMYSTVTGTTQFMRDVIEPAGVVPERITRIQLTEAIFELVAADLGVTVMSRWAVAPWIRNGALTAVRLTERGFLRKWFVAVRADDVQQSYQADLIDLLRRNLAGGPFLAGQRIA